MKPKWLVLVFVSALTWLGSAWWSAASAVPYGSGAYGDCVYGGEVGDSALSFSVGTSNINLGPISANSTGAATATFSAALKCTNLGYLVKMYGSPPSNGSHTLNALASATASVPGSEQYGINLVDNSVPDIGANPAGGSGIAASGYNTTNQFKYASGDTIASVATYSDATTYTISFIANANNVTPAGLYTGTHNLVCIAAF